MPRATAEPDTRSVAVAVFAKAPIPGFAKTRLAPVLGADGAAALQARFIERTVGTALAADVGPVTLWCAPDCSHPAFRRIAARSPVGLVPQPDGDLGIRMAAVFAAAAGPTLLVGTDCPVLTPEHLRACAAALTRADAVFLPVEDGGYVLVGLGRPAPGLFDDMTWSTPCVMAQTRTRLRRMQLSWAEPELLWDVDDEADLTRCRTLGLL
ncbi:MAG: TIGR04282 family arsenosugar biosynthesis glycosyltransferase [Alphaproteobacteria bacterium]